MYVCTVGQLRDVKLTTAPSRFLFLFCAQAFLLLWRVAIYLLPVKDMTRDVRLSFDIELHNRDDLKDKDIVRRCMPLICMSPAANVAVLMML